MIYRNRCRWIDSGWERLFNDVSSSCSSISTWPDEFAILLLEPIDVEDLGQFILGGSLGERQPMSKVVGHVISTEGQHSKGIMSLFAGLSFSCRSLFRRYSSSHKCTMIPVEGLIDEGYYRGTTSSKDDSRDGDTYREYVLWMWIHGLLYWN